MKNLLVTSFTFLPLHASSLLIMVISLYFHCLSVHSQGLMVEPPSPSTSSSSSSSSSRSPPPPPHHLLSHAFQRILLSIFFGFFTGLIAALFLAFLLRCFIQYINKTPLLKGPVIFSPKIAPDTLQLALQNDNHLLGSSPNGLYYRTVLDNGLTIAVKILEPFQNGSPQTKSKSLKRLIQHDLQVLAGLRHRNLMSLRAFIREPHRFSLVYDYIPNGSLEDTMNRVRHNQLELSWEKRLRIAVGIIKGLRYLHFECVPKIFHCNLKPTNVMLDAEFEPRLADTGLAKLMPNMDRAAAARGGYSAPECLLDCSRYSEKSDVFSFGVILGVLLTGRDPTDQFFGEVTVTSNGGSLGRWLRHLQEAGEAREAIDKSILGDEVEEDEMLMAVRIAVVCLSNLPAHRPSSDELVPMLTQLHSF